MSSESAIISVSHIFKSYLLFDKPSHRLWQMLFRGRRQFFKEHEVLHDINFEIPRGQTVGLVGRNGAGKSTLLSILCSTLTPSQGSVDVRGRVAALLELGAGFNPELTGRENIDLCAQIYGLSEEEIESKRHLIIEFADIGEYIDRPVKMYSSGMFTRLGFSVVAHVDADVLVVDEALAVGDAYFVQKCMRYLHGFCERGGTLVFVSHDMGSVTALCDRVIWLKGGVVAMDDTPKVVAGAYLADLYRVGQGEAMSDEAQKEFTQADASVANLESEDVDPRAPRINASALRNELEIFRFSKGHDFGSAGAAFQDAAFIDALGRRMSWMVGGELVQLALDLVVLKPIQSLIIGFVVKDKKGQPLFGDNTFLTYLDHPLSAAAGERVRATFEFRMPVLPVGDYAVSLAVADGSQRSHEMHQWIHDAMVFSSRSTSLATGLIGIPMRKIECLVSAA